MLPGGEPFKLREIWPPGTVIKGDYIVERKLGGGGFGTVYLAQHRFLKTAHLIKRLHEHYASDAEFVNKFIREGQAIRRLRACPHVIEVEHMTQSEDGHLILVMEHVGGGDLDDLMKSRPLTIAEVVEFSRQIVTALAAAHAAQLIHRDVKPQNVLMGCDEAGRPLLKLIDFGIAADHRRGTQTTRRVLGICGSGAVGAFGQATRWQVRPVCARGNDVQNVDRAFAVSGCTRGWGLVCARAAAARSAGAVAGRYAQGAFRAGSAYAGVLSGGPPSRCGEGVEDPGSDSSDLVDPRLNSYLGLYCDGPTSIL